MVHCPGALKSCSADRILFIKFSTSCLVLSKLFLVFRENIKTTIGSRVTSPDSKVQFLPYTAIHTGYSIIQIVWFFLKRLALHNGLYTSIMFLLAYCQTDMSGNVICKLLHSGGWTVVVACMAQTHVPVRNPRGRRWIIPGGRPAAARKTVVDWTVV